MNDEKCQPNRDTSYALERKWRQDQKRLDIFWDHWHKEYLLSLRETLPLRHKGVRSAINSVPQEGEVVLIKEQDTPRGTWMMGRIEETIVGGASNVRSAKVHLPSRKIISRPINLLYPLELPVKHDHTTNCRPGVS